MLFQNSPIAVVFIHPPRQGHESRAPRWPAAAALVGCAVRHKTGCRILRILNVVNPFAEESGSVEVKHHRFGTRLSPVAGVTDALPVRAVTGDPTVHIALFRPL